MRNAGLPGLSNRDFAVATSVHSFRCSFYFTQMNTCTLNTLKAVVNLKYISFKILLLIKVFPILILIAINEVIV
jgi:hypothetical protein